MSRLIVKNLPKSVTDTKLKELFSTKGVVTDVQLKYTESGKFRRFAFVGFKTEEQAAAAVIYFNNTCIDTCRIVVDYCAGLGDITKSKSWSKYANDSNKQVKPSKNNTDKCEQITIIDSTENTRLIKNTSLQQECKEVIKNGKIKKKEKEKSSSIKEVLVKHNSDPLFNEFIESHVKDETKHWSNDLLVADKEENKSIHEDSNEGCTKDNTYKQLEQNESYSDEKIAEKNISDKDYMEVLKNKTKNFKCEITSKSDKTHGTKKFYTVKIRGLGYNHKKKDIKQFFKGLSLKSVRVPTTIKGIAYVGFKTEKLMKQALNKNKSFLDGKRIFVSKYEKVEKNFEEGEEPKLNLRWKQQEETLKSEESIAESGRIFLRNLTYTTTEEDVKNLFEKYGPLTEVNLPIDKITRKLKGFGTVTYLMPEHAVKAYSELDGSTYAGRMLHLLPAKTKTTSEDIDIQDGLSYKQKKILKEKTIAQSPHNWNTLFLGQNAIADAIATSYNTTKEKVLHDDNSTSIAVRLALGETQLVQETRKFLEDNEVELCAFNQAPNKRSKTIILVKNLPAGTRVQEIKELFVKFGELGRVILPPSGITAIVEFIEPSEARKAFIKLAYSKFKHLPLYLEWAPDNSLRLAVSKGTSEEYKERSSCNAPKQAVEEKVVDMKTDVTRESQEDDDEPEVDTTLFVKNLNFNTTEKQLHEHFSRCGPLHYANISTKKDSKNPGNKLSMGYGFVRYKLKSDAEKALKDLQMTLLDGKTLELKRSERTLQSDIETIKKSTKITKQTGTKILVRNVPFQANANEVKDLFKAFGELKAVRLPKKMVGDENHRGFAFVEFYTKKEAQRAFTALCQSTHLYGRRLVLEWAQTEEGIDDLRKRTAKHFHDVPNEIKRTKSVLNPESIGLDTEQ